MALWPRSEEQLAAVVVAWLRDQHWRVYQEVDTGAGRVDILAEQVGQLWAIECKTSFGLDVISQADRHRERCTFASAATPRQFVCDLGEVLCKLRGVGVLFVTSDGVRELVAPRPNRRAPVTKVLAKLEPEHETFCAAGTAGGGHWSPFKRTCRDVLAYVTAHPGCTVKALVDGVRHHYRDNSSARSNLPRWIEARKVPGVRLSRNGRELRVYVDSST